LLVPVADALGEPPDFACMELWNREVVVAAGLVERDLERRLLG
jgi:hypothetical protein